MCQFLRKVSPFKTRKKKKKKEKKRKKLWPTRTRYKQTRGERERERERVIIVKQPERQTKDTEKATIIKSIVPVKRQTKIAADEIFFYFLFQGK